jgi:hypothetical protein
MHLSEFVLLVIATVAAIAAGLAVVASNYRAARVLFYIAALSFGSMGVVWALNSDTSLVKQMAVAFVVAGTGAAGLVYGLWEAENAQKKGDSSHSSAVPAHAEDSKPNSPATNKNVGKNSPNISAGGNVTIGHIGDVVNTPTASLQKPVDEKLPGFASGMMVQTDDVPDVRRKYQYSFRAPDGAKVGFYLSASNRYAFSVTDINGEEYKLDIPLGANGIPFGKWAYIFCEVGTASSYSYLRALLNGKEVARRDFDFPLELGSRRWIPVLGADSSGQNGGAFMMMEIGAFSTTLSDQELMALAENALSAYGLKP